jgi:phosphoribosylglycinamide formyltransferase-1
MPKLPLAIFASGGGSNAEAIIHYSYRTDAAYRVALLVSNNSQCMALQRALMFGIPTLHLSNVTHPEPAAYNTTLLKTLQQHKIEIIALAGYMKKLPAEVIAGFYKLHSTHGAPSQMPCRIFNIHPSLLPRYGGAGMYGTHVHEAVLAAREHTSGLTIHEVNAEYDSGAIVKQHSVEVLPNDTADSLAQRINRWELKLYPEVLNDVAASLQQRQRI